MLNVETTAEFKVWPRNRNQANKHFTESQDPNKGMFQLCCMGWNYQQCSILIFNINFSFQQTPQFISNIKNQQQNNTWYLKVLSFLHAHTSLEHANIFLISQEKATSTLPVVRRNFDCL